MIKIRKKCFPEPPELFKKNMQRFFSILKDFHTVRNLHFLSKNSTLISRENCRFFWVKNSWKCCGYGLFSCWQPSFHEKNCQKYFGWKTRDLEFVKIEWHFHRKIWFGFLVPLLILPQETEFQLCWTAFPNFKACTSFFPCRNHVTLSLQS